MGKLVSRSLTVVCGVLIAIAMTGIGSAQAASNTGGVDLNGYCRSLGYSHVTLVDGTAYGWRCVTYGGGQANISMTHVCQVQKGYATIDRTANFYSPYSWECWQTGGNLGGVDLNGYCRSLGYSHVALIDGTAYGWRCITYGGGQAHISMTHVCQVQKGYATIDRMANFYNPYSWQCWA